VLFVPVLLDPIAQSVQDNAPAAAEYFPGPQFVAHGAADGNPPPATLFIVPTVPAVPATQGAHAAPSHLWPLPQVIFHGQSKAVVPGPLYSNVPFLFPGAGPLEQGEQAFPFL
jgi:hypothetical protein